MRSHRHLIEIMWSTLTGTVLLILELLLVAFLVSCKPKALEESEYPESRYVRQQTGNKTAIVFIHGVLGDAVTTWTSSNKKYWPDLLAQDHHFDGADIFVYAYPSPTFGKSYTIDDLAENMRLRFQATDPKLFDHQEVVFLAHSMGGLVTRAFLLKYREMAQKVKFVYFFATPTTGSALGNLAAALSRNPQFLGLVSFPDQQYLPSLQTGWLDAGFPIASYCAFETIDTYKVRIVDRQSATNLCTQPLDPIDADHINIVKPRGVDDAPYVAFLNAYEATRKSAGVATTSVEQKDVRNVAVGSQPIDAVLTDAISVSSGGGFSCVANKSRRAYCWGSNSFGKLGNGTLAPSSKPVAVSGNIKFYDLSLGDNHACGISVSGDGYCWGRNDYGQLGDSSTNDRATPVRVSGSIKFNAIRAGLGRHTCGLGQDGTAYCWGLNNQGQLGNGTTLNSTIPVRVSSDPRFGAIAVGAYHSCAVGDPGIGWCWGYNVNGALGDGNTERTSIPVKVSLVHSLGAIHAGSFFTCATTQSGVATCWGNNAFGGLGNGAPGNSSQPVQVAGGLTLSSITTGNYHACAIAAAGAGYCWGFGDFGSLGNGQKSSSPTPVAVSGGLVFSRISAGVDHTCAIATNGSVFCWGRNDLGQLGNGNLSPSAAPVQVLKPE